MLVDNLDETIILNEVISLDATPFIQNNSIRRIIENKPQNEAQFLLSIDALRSKFKGNYNPYTDSMQ